LGLRVWGLEFGAWGVYFRVSGFGLRGLELRVAGISILGFSV